jgi:cytochrome c
LAASDQGTADEAAAMVKKAVAFAKANGKEKLLAEVVNNKGQFVDRDLYISVWNSKAVVLAHGANPKLIGKDIIDLKDADGKSFMKEIVNKAASAGSGWVDYKWVNPVSKEIQAKSAYFEKMDDMIISTGYYKK